MIILNRAIIKENIEKILMEYLPMNGVSKTRDKIVAYIVKAQEEVSDSLLKGHGGNWLSI